MNKITTQTKSFLVLFGLAILGTAFGIWINNREEQGPRDEYQVITYDKPQQTSQADKPLAYRPVQQEPETLPDTSGWKTYTIKDYGLSFAADPSWKVKSTTTKYGYTMLPIDPGAKYDDFKIYVSKKGFFALEGLPQTKDDTIAGYPALNLQGIVYGIKHGDTYYTFDLGYSLSLKNQFAALVKTVNFNN